MPILCTPPLRAGKSSFIAIQSRMRESGVKDHVPHENRDAESTAGRRDGQGTAKLSLCEMFGTSFCSIFGSTGGRSCHLYSQMTGYKAVQIGWSSQPSSDVIRRRRVMP
jgi:hypothetical protein